VRSCLTFKAVATRRIFSSLVLSELLGRRNRTTRRTISSNEVLVGIFWLTGKIPRPRKSKKNERARSVRLSQTRFLKSLATSDNTWDEKIGACSHGITRRKAGLSPGRPDLVFKALLYVNSYSVSDRLSEVPQHVVDNEVKTLRH